MRVDDKILIGRGDEAVFLLPSMANRHGLIAGATGTGKTVTLKVLAEGLSSLGVPVFLADVKGDVSSLALPGARNEKLDARLTACGLDPAAFAPQSFPVRFWDLFGENGIPVRATVSDVGPMLFSRLLALTEAQTGVLNIAFQAADDNGWELLDLKDLRAMLGWVADHRKELTTRYGNVSSQSVGAIQRALLTLEQQGAARFFGEPMLNIADWFTRAPDGRGTINLLHCVELARRPTLYAAFLLWMLGELFELLPEVGDAPLPRLVFFFDEAHLLFDGAPKALVDRVTQVVRLIRSKGVGVFFITQSPADLPDPVLAQLNNRIQHALRAYTPAEQRAVRAAAQSFRPNPAFRTEEAIGSMGTGVALVSMLDADGAPLPVERATICPPQSAFTALSDAERRDRVLRDDLMLKYRDAVDSYSAYEALSDAAAAEAAQAQAAAEQAARAKEEAREAAARARQQQKKQDQWERSLRRAGQSAARSVGRDLGRSITRGVLGNKGSASRAAGNFAGTLMGDLLSGLLK